MLNMENFGRLISDKRKEARLTQETFAAKLGITAQAVSKWENGLTYPDVTLFPEIAQILNIPISTLFGEEENKEVSKNRLTFGKAYRSAPLVYNTERVGCYSTKSVMRIDEDSATVFFTDGSYADLANRIVKNCGAGEVYIKKASENNDDFDANTPGNIAQKLDKFENVRISISCSCDVYINKSKSFEIAARGSKRFLSLLKYEVRNNELLIEFERNNNNNNNASKSRVDIFVDMELGKNMSVVINGSGLLKSEIAFEGAKFSINGCGKALLTSLKELSATINGAGDLVIKNVTEKADLSINGAGNAKFETANNVKVSVNGAGELNIGKTSGDLDIRVSGSAEVEAGGKVDKLYCKISGGAEINCGELTVDEAEIYAENSAQIHIGRIVKSSVEQLGMMTELTVDKRG